MNRRAVARCLRRAAEKADEINLGSDMAVGMEYQAWCLFDSIFADDQSAYSYSFVSTQHFVLALLFAAEMVEQGDI